MAEQEINDLQRHSAIQDARISSLETKFEMFMQEMRERDKIRAEEMQDFKNEMRTQNLLRAKEFSELSKKQEKAQEKHDADIKEINTRIDEKFERLLSQIQNMAIAAVVGVGAVVAAVVSIMK